MRQEADMNARDCCVSFFWDYEVPREDNDEVVSELGRFIDKTLLIKCKSTPSKAIHDVDSVWNCKHWECIRLTLNYICASWWNVEVFNVWERQEEVIIVGLDRELSK